MKKVTYTATITLAGFLFPVIAFSQTLSPQKFKEKQEKEKGIIIDVRTPEEYAAERIKGAMNINIKDSLFIQEINKLDKKRSYFLYCGIGKRSAMGVTKMKENGFAKVYDLEKGLGEWKEKGFSTEK